MKNVLGELRNKEIQDLAKRMMEKYVESPSNQKVQTNEQWKSLPRGWTQASLDAFARSLTGKTKGDPEGFVRACVAKMKDTGIDDPYAFCASLKDKYLGRTTWRGPSK